LGYIDTNDLMFAFRMLQFQSKRLWRLKKAENPPRNIFAKAKRHTNGCTSRKRRVRPARIPECGGSKASIEAACLQQQQSATAKQIPRSKAMLNCSEVERWRFEELANEAEAMKLRVADVDRNRWMRRRLAGHTE
jgi:hypothetical protein